MDSQNVELHPAVSQDRYGIVSAIVALDTTIPISSRAVYAALCAHADAAGFLEISHARIASYFGRSRPWAVAALQPLEAAGYLVHRRRYISGRQTISVYQLADGDLARATRRRRQQPASHPSSNIPDTGVTCVAVPTQFSDTEQVLQINNNPFKPKLVDANDAIKPISPTWSPSSEDCDYVRVVAPDLDIAFFVEHFRVSCVAHGYRYIDYGSAFRMWALRHQAASRKKPISSPKPIPSQLTEANIPSAVPKEQIAPDQEPTPPTHLPDEIAHVLRMTAGSHDMSVIRRLLPSLIPLTPCGADEPIRLQATTSPAFGTAQRHAHTLLLAFRRAGFAASNVEIYSPRERFTSGKSHPRSTTKCFTHIFESQADAAKAGRFGASNE